MNILRPTVEDAAKAWAELVAANREQVLRLRERIDGPDFWKGMAQVFRVDPDRQGDATLDALKALVLPGETWLDVGAGGGRFALPLAHVVEHLVAIEPSGSMLDVLREGMAEHSITNIDIVEGRWESTDAPVGDAALFAHVGYDIDDIVPFVEKLERQAHRLCVAVMLDRQPATNFASLFEAIFGEKQATLPALREFLPLQMAAGRLVDVHMIETDPWSFVDREDALKNLRWRFWINEGTDLDRRLDALMDDHVKEIDGRWSTPGAKSYVGIVTWPGRAAG